MGLAAARRAGRFGPAGAEAAPAGPFFSLLEVAGTLVNAIVVKNIVESALARLQWAPKRSYLAITSAPITHASSSAHELRDITYLFVILYNPQMVVSSRHSADSMMLLTTIRCANEKGTEPDPRDRPETAQTIAASHLEHVQAEAAAPIPQSAARTDSSTCERG